MRPVPLAIILLLSLTVAGAARADVGKAKCKDPKNYVFSQTSGCIKRPPAREKTASESYVNGLDALDTDPKKAFALFETACTRKSYAQACLQLGLLYQSGRGRAVLKDPKKALALYERGCELGDGAACQRRGDEARKEGDQKLARSWFTRGCAKDDGVACGFLALMLDKGHGGDKDAAGAQTQYDKAHRLMESLCPGNGLACYLRGYFFEIGAGVKADLPRAMAAYRLGCAQSFGDACWRTAYLLDREKGDDKDAIAHYVKACEYENADGCTRAAGRLSDADHKATYPVELAERGCNLDTKECGTLAQMYRLGRGMAAPDQIKATAIFKNTCDAGDQFICVTYAKRLHDGVGTPGDKPLLAEADRIVEAACKQEEETGCTQLAQWVHDGKKDDARAFRFADRGCTLRSARACFLASFMARYERRGTAAAGGLASKDANKDANKETINNKDALAFAEKGCELGSGNACNEAGELYELANDLKKALERYRSACAATDDNNGQGCVALAIALAQGKGADKDPKGTNRAATRACSFKADKCPWVPGTTVDADDIKHVSTELTPLCERGYHASCVALAQSLFKSTSDDKKRGRELLAASCKQKDMPACVTEAAAIHSGTGSDADPAKADQLYRKYCDDRDADACFQVAFNARDVDGKLTLEYADKACTLGHAEACNVAGFVHYTAKKPVPWDITAAVKYYAKACDLGSAIACGNLGEVYRWGLGAPVDAKKAFELYKKSCDAGAQYGCAGYGYYIARGEAGAKRDPKEAEAIYRKSCDADTIEACVELAQLLESTKTGSLQEIARVRLRAFSLAEQQSATNPEYMYRLGTFYRDGLTTTKQPAKALELFVKACDSFDPFGCIAAGTTLAASPKDADQEQAKVYFQRACAAGIEDGCKGLARGAAPVAPGPAVVQAKG
ncbi:MAG: sel1 repeat family protein, partial [Deltaproteobacteria bacterium]|nr:sel1 repeat family protein [Deltaproteobacteria bacterium]